MTRTRTVTRAAQVAATFVAVMAARVLQVSGYPAPTLTAVIPDVAMEARDVQLVVEGIHLQDTLNITLHGPSTSATCHLPAPGANWPNITDCLIQMSRQDACDIAGAAFFIPEGELRPCDDDGDCEWAESTSIGCAPPSPAQTCIRQRCYYPVDVQCYGFADTPDFSPCDVGRACVDNVCVDAKGVSCPASINCTIDADSGLLPGLYDVHITTANDTFVLPGSFRLVPEPAVIFFSTARFVGVAAFDDASTSSSAPEYVADGVISPGAELGVAIGRFSDDGAYLHDAGFWVDGATYADGAPFPVVDIGAELYAPVVVHLWIIFTEYTASPLIATLNYTATYAPPPTIASLCPSAVLAFVENLVVVQGENFIDFPTTECRVDGAVVPHAVINDRTLHCWVALVTNVTGSVHTAQATNDGVVEAAASGTLTVLGACATLKPGSSPVGSECLCDPGYADTGTVCIPCADGMYQPGVGQIACIPCDSTETTGGTTGSIAQSACRCADGRFRVDPLDVSCALCTTGMICEGGKLMAAEGYWRHSNTSAFVECPAGAAACAGGDGQGDQLCGKGYEGPLCSVCSRGYGSLGAVCVKCESSWVNIFVTVLIAGLLVAFVWVLVRSTTRASDDNVEFGTIVRIGFNYIQVLYFVGKLSTDWGALTDKLFTGTEVAALTPSFLSAECALRVSFYEMVVVTMFLPLVAIVACSLPLIFLPCRKWIPSDYVIHQHGPAAVMPISSGTLLRKWLTTVVIVLYLIHPAVARWMLLALRCEAVPGTGTQYVRDDMRIDCNSAKYQIYRGFIVVYILLYVIGAVVFVGSRMRTLKRQPPTQLTSEVEAPSYRYLSQGYNDRRYLWEGYVLARKFAIVACEAFLSSIQQLYWGSVIIALSLALTMLRKPYTKVEFTRLDAMTLFSLFGTASLGFISLSTEGHTKIVIFVLVLLLFAVTMLMIFAAAIKRTKRGLQAFFAAVAARFFYSDEKLFERAKTQMRRRGSAGPRELGPVVGGMPPPPDLIDFGNFGQAGTPSPRSDVRSAANTPVRDLCNGQVEAEL